MMARAWLAKPEGLRCKNHINIASKQYNTCELRVSARPGKGARELELMLALRTFLVDHGPASDVDQRRDRDRRRRPERAQRLL